MGGEGIMIFLLFFIPAAVFFAAYAIMRRRWMRKFRESAFAGLLDED
jgi:hypothetical protein